MSRAIERDSKVALAFSESLALMSSQNKLSLGLSSKLGDKAGEDINHCLSIVLGTHSIINPIANCGTGGICGASGAAASAPPQSHQRAVSSLGKDEGTTISNT